MKKTNALNLLAGLLLIPVLFHLASCEKEAIEPIENSEVTESYIQQVAQDNSSLLPTVEEQLDETDVAFNTDISSPKKWEVAIKVIAEKEDKHYTLVAVKSNDTSFHFDEHKQYEIFWLKEKEKKKLAFNSKLHVLCGNKYTVVVWDKKSLTRFFATVKVTCPFNPGPQGPDKIPFSKF